MSNGQTSVSGAAGPKPPRHGVEPPSAGRGLATPGGEGLPRLEWFLKRHHPQTANSLVFFGGKTPVLTM